MYRVKHSVKQPGFSPAEIAMGIVLRKRLLTAQRSINKVAGIASETYYHVNVQIIAPPRLLNTGLPSGINNAVVAGRRRRCFTTGPEKRCGNLQIVKSCKT